MITKEKISTTYGLYNLKRLSYELLKERDAYRQLAIDKWWDRPSKKDEVDAEAQKIMADRERGES